MKKNNKRFFSRGLATLVVMTMLLPNILGVASANELEPEATSDAPEVSISVVSVSDPGSNETAADEKSSNTTSEEASDTTSEDAAEDETTGEDSAENETTSEDAGENETTGEDVADGETTSEDAADTDGEEVSNTTGEEDSNSTEASENDDVWNDITDTKRPEASSDVSADKGTDKDKGNENKNWEVFYDADRDVYKVTFNIGEGADAKTQTIDLTQALEILGQYVDTGKKELQDQINALEKPVKEELSEPTKAELPEEPKAPAAPADFEMTEPEEPEEPSEPTPEKPEACDVVKDDFLGFFTENMMDSDQVVPSGFGGFTNSIKSNLIEMGMDSKDSYTTQYAKYINDVAYYTWAEYQLSTNGPGVDWILYIETNNGTVEEAMESIQSGSAKLKEPLPPVDKNSEAYKAYETAKAEYDSKLVQYQTDKAAYDAALEAYLAEHGPDSEEGKAYAEAKAEYDALKAEYEKKVAEIEAAYEAAVADYNTKKAEIEAKFADDKAAYDAAVKKLKAEFDRRIGANVLEPGDVKKFELFLTSDSKHTYKYQSGSFTLATPEWQVNPDGTVVGFDGQILPDEYVDFANYHVTLRCEPIQKMLESLGMDDYDRFNGYASYWDFEIKDFLSKYEGETVADRLNSYILEFYGNEYETIDDLVKNNPDARAELTKTITSGNKWFDISGETFVVDAHLATVKYDNFYQNLFSFAFGDEADIDKILEGAHFNEGTNRWEYDNKSWTDNGYLNALYYYMDHKEIWQQTDAYFGALLDGGLSKEQATWTSLMMALNIDGELTGNDWQDTKWPWYSSIQLERVDIDFNLTKKDGETGETITGSETEFQIWYIDKVKDEDGNETEVKMYCTQTTDENGEISYTFVTTPGTVKTENGELNISYAMMKDIVYYLQEIVAPDGYDLDTNVYIVMSEEDYNKLSDEDKEALEGTFDKFLDMTTSSDGLSVSTNFVNVKIVHSNPDPDPTPDPGPGPGPGPNPTPTPDPDPEPEIPDTPTPLAPPPEEEVFEEEVPLAEVPEEEVPLAEPPVEEEVEVPEVDVPLSDVPRTGDISAMWYAMMAVSAAGLLTLTMMDRKKRQEI